MQRMQIWVGLYSHYNASLPGYSYLSLFSISFLFCMGMATIQLYGRCMLSHNTPTYSTISLGGPLLSYSFVLLSDNYAVYTCSDTAGSLVSESVSFIAPSEYTTATHHNVSSRINRGHYLCT